MKKVCRYKKSKQKRVPTFVCIFHDDATTAKGPGCDKGTNLRQRDCTVVPLMPTRDNAAFNLDLHCLLRQNRSLDKEIEYCLQIITCDPSIYTVDHPDFIVCSFMENSIGLKGVIFCFRASREDEEAGEARGDRGDKK